MREEGRAMSGGDGQGNGDGPGKTVFRPSPLQGLRQNGGVAPPSTSPFAPAAGYAADPGYGAPPPLSRGGLGPQGSGLAPSRLAEDDVPLPATPRTVRNVMLAEAEPVLALVAGVRSGRVRLAMPEFHRQASQAIARFEQAIAPHYSEEKRQRAKYAVCATTDDVAQNLPGIGTDGAEWARRSMVVQFFQENIGGDRFWQLVDDMLRTPNDNADLIELFHASLAAGFEGRFRIMPDGRRRLHEIMARLQGALPHVRSLSATKLSPRWKGENAPLGRLSFWGIIALVAAIAAGILLLAFIVFKLLLMSNADTPSERLAAIRPSERLTLSRPGGGIAQADSAQASKLKRFLEPEIREGLVTVEEDAQTVRVRTTVGQLFRSGSDVLEAGREPLFHRIGRAIEEEQGSVTIEGHADSDRVGSLQFPDNMALSQARAETVGKLVRTDLSDPARVTTKGLGETVPIASNDNAAGKSQNRRVEIIVPRRY
ncbi:type IVB secretion system protein IcmH/DotU [Sphingomonas sp. PB4P5]|uniref:type IVB secretion system protein IcmH/DotU n=1 Tax=Parasphingomonas puruogangriensis TaxID=3096155 RepID=UPI002FC71AC6